MRAPEGLATISDAGSASKLSNADALKVCNAELSFPLVDQTPSDTAATIPVCISRERGCAGPRK